MHCRKSRPWTKEEDAILREAVESYEKEEPISWNDIASRIEGRSNKDCRKRWVCGLAPRINKGPWVGDEDELLREGVRLHGTRWTAVSQIVGSRQANQCSRRWHEVVKPNINRERWSIFEEEMLKRAVVAHGRKWIEIVERYFPDRTPIATRQRWV
ncbi:hypothetical protein AOQ84DRAFT_368788 [Glonium stellatum]|uniref:Homeodomain-like protein n=1 Tax=Glonium stellatum TaxID=574774 RepID=A0A8E2EQC8_9PEZI|nr:hypothetical protein AOQ84DRAFT_368788 [Glonium stellatum]